MLAEMNRVTTRPVPGLSAPKTAISRLAAPLLSLMAGAALAAANQSPPFPCGLESIPVRVATNMCISLGARVESDVNPSALTNLVDGSDQTTWAATGPFFVALELNATNLDDDCLLLHWRAENGQWHDFDFVTESFNKMTVKASRDSTDGRNGAWTTLTNLDNKRRDGVLVLPNTRPKWLRVEEASTVRARIVRLDVFRPAPIGFRNDYWMFVGDSLTAAATGAGMYPAEHTRFFSDLIRSKFPRYYPIVLNEGKGGETGEGGAARLFNTVIPENPMGTFICFHEGINTISSVPRHAYPGKTNLIDQAIRKMITDSLENGYVPIVARLAFARYNNYAPIVDYPADQGAEKLGTLPYNVNVVDKLIEALTPYAYDFGKHLPRVDFYTWFRDHQEGLRPDGVHHLPAGTDAETQIWADNVGALVYGKQDR
jgi:hypothetical protein